MATTESLARVQQLYVAYYGRPADQEGQEYWAERLEAEGESAIIDAFGNSAEYTELAEGKGNATLVNNIYLQAFGRDADPEGLAYYAGVLERGEKPLAEIATTIINAAAGEDKHVFDARVEAAADYTAEFGAEADYDIVAAKDIVENAEPGLYVPELTPAIETYQDAVQAKSDFLQNEAAKDSAVAKQLEALQEGDDEKPSDEQIEDAIAAVVAEKEGAVEEAGGLTFEGDADNVIAAKIEAKQKAFTKAVTDAEKAVAETDGLQAAINSLLAAEGRYESALKAEVKTDKALEGEIAKYNALNDDATFSTNDDGTIEGLIKKDGGTLVAAEGVEPGEGFEALLAAAQAQYDATEAVGTYETAFEKAVTKVLNTENDSDDASAEGAYSVEGTEVTLTVGGDAQALIDAEAELAAFEKAVADYEDAQALPTQLESLNKAVSDAEKAFEDMDIDLNGQDDAIDNELYIFDGEPTAVSDFGAEGEDLLYIGDDYTRVDLNLDAGEDISSTDQGDVNTLEVFFEQDGSDAMLYVENKAFAGSSESGFDLTAISLSGVNVDDLSLENGYITVA